MYLIFIYLILFIIVNVLDAVLFILLNLIQKSNNNYRFMKMRLGKVSNMDKAHVWWKVEL